MEWYVEYSTLKSELKDYPIDKLQADLCEVRYGKINW